MEELVRRREEPEEKPTPGRVVLPPREPPAPAPAPVEAEVEPAAERTPEVGSALLHSLASESSDQEPLPELSLADRFDEHEVLGEGGSGVVRRATERATGREVAIKRLRAACDPQAFLREARAVESLEHPRIVRLLEVVRSERGVALVFEHVQGPNLEAFAQREGPLNPLRALELAQELGGALAYAHEQGLVHRDVKPQNVLLDRAGQAKLTDFGLALSVSVHSLISGGWVGTLDYMAPEQRVAADRVDARADVYGLGATLYRLLSGRSPRVIREALVPSAVRALVLRCVEEDPRDRYPSMHALLEAMRELEAQLRRDRSGVTAPLEKVSADFLRRLNVTRNDAHVRRLLVATRGLVGLGLLPSSYEPAMRARLALEEGFEAELSRIVDQALDAAPGLSAETQALTDAHALLTTALSGSELSEEARTILGRLRRHSRRLRRPELSVRLAGACERLVARSALPRPFVRELVELARVDGGRVVFHRVLDRLRQDAEAEEGERWPAAASRWRHALDELAACVFEHDLLEAVRRERLALELLAVARKPVDEDEDAADELPA
ncbi:MAG: serine/threonine-protein kinase [Planctomycetota bacterium]